MGTDISAVVGLLWGKGLHFVLQENCEFLEGIQRRAISGVQ